MGHALATSSDRASGGSHRLDPLLAPRSIALVGASQRANSPGNQMVRLPLGHGFRGKLYPINPRYSEVEGLRCYASLDELPETVDHVVIGVASERVEQALENAIRHGARAATIFSNCHLEDDGEPALGERLAAMAREAELQMCGPNCMGFISPESDLMVGAFPSPGVLQPGPITWIAQSGSVYAALAYNDRRLRFNLCVSSGSEYVTRASDYMDWALGRPSTRILALFLESVRHPEGFEAALAEAARREIAVVVLKTGRTPASAAMARTHTGALAGDDAAYQALFDKYGVIRVRELDELAATLILLSQPRRAGPGGLATIHDSGGECELMADLASDVGVRFAEIGAKTHATLEESLDPGLHPSNPLDAWGTGHDAVGVFERCLLALMEDPNTAAGLLVADMRTGYQYHANLAAVARAVAGRTDKPLAFATNYSLVLHHELALDLTDAGVPVLDGTREALEAFRHLVEYRDFRARPALEPPAPPAAQVSKRWRDRLGSGEPLDEVEGLALLADYGIPTPGAARAGSRREAIAAAAELGYPVVLKTCEPGIEHKSDVGGVVLGVADPGELGAAYDDLSARLGPRVSVARMAERGVEMALGAIRDEQFGPYVMVAAGGVLVELLGDRRVAAAPTDAAAARRMLEGLRVHRLLAGARGRPPADLESLAQAVARLSVLAADLQDVLDQLDVNPIIATPAGCMAVDALVIPRAR